MDSSLRASGAILGGTIGFMCGYVEAWYSGSQHPLLDAVSDAVSGAVLGAVLGKFMSVMPGQLQIGFGMVLGVLGIADTDDPAIAALRASCTVAEFAFGGGLKHVDDMFRKIDRPKSVDDWLESVKRFLADESGSMPIPSASSRDGNLVLGRGTPEMLADAADALLGKVIDNPVLKDNPRLLWKHIYSEMRKAKKIFQIIDGIPPGQVASRGTGEWARAETIIIESMPHLLAKRRKFTRAQLGLDPHDL